MSNARLLLIEPDQLLRRSLTYNLEQAGYTVIACSSAEDGLEAARQHHPDLVLLAIELPGMDGFDGLKLLRADYDIPVIMVTRRIRKLDEVLALELGADDYVRKPFDQEVLMARIKAILRRSGKISEQPLTTKTIHVGDLTIDPAAHNVRMSGSLIELPPTEFELLYALAMDAGEVVSTEDLLIRVWGAEYSGESQVVYVHMHWLREKIEQDPNNPCRIITIHGVGYKLIPQTNAGTAEADEL